LLFIPCDTEACHRADCRYHLPYWDKTSCHSNCSARHCQWHWWTPCRTSSQQL